MSLVRRPDRRERILALAADLRGRIEWLDLQEIDGEFYWRICRDALVEPLIQIAASFAPSFRGTAAELHEIVADLHADEDRSRAFYASAAGAAVAALPRHVWDYLVMGEPIPLRPTRMLFHPPDVLRLRVISRAFTGGRLERALARYGAYPRRELGPDLDDRASLRIDFALVREPSMTEPLGVEEPDTFPYVEVAIARPLPPKGLAGSAYDAIVREQRRWHLELAGGETVQEKDVAVRTWAIGLLMREGLSFGRAVRALETRWGDLYIGQETDRQARNRLMDRVPEARPYLRPRSGWGDDLGKADG